jgi:poly(ADP-ribose) glycohydrolase
MGSASFSYRNTEVVAMNAINFHQQADQYQQTALERELDKAYCGFYSPNQRNSERLRPVATGNWGCGAFNGDPYLKFMIQLMAAAHAGRDIQYHLIGDKVLEQKLLRTYENFQEKNVTVGVLFKHLCLYYNDFVQPKSLYDFMCQVDIKH